MLTKRRTPDKYVVKRTSLASTGEIVDVFSDINNFNADKLTQLADQAYKNIRQIFGFNYDHYLLGERINIYCSEAVMVSHVHGGYLQPQDPVGAIFLNARAAQGAIHGSNATYIHEMTHLFTWNFYSHTLREGLADYVASRLHLESAIGPVPVGFDLQKSELIRFSRYWATTKKPPRQLKSDMTFRRGYYYSSRLFVAYLIEKFGFDSFISLYGASDPETEIKRRFAESRAELVTSFIDSTRV
jgi:hypothetical protein